MPVSATFTGPTSATCEYFPASDSKYVIDLAGAAVNAATDCGTTNAAGEYCRRFSVNGGASWSGFAWSSVAYNDAYCSTVAQKCVNKAQCAATTAWCQWPGGSGAHWSTAATCTP